MRACVRACVRATWFDFSNRTHVRNAHTNLGVLFSVNFQPPPNPHPCCQPLYHLLAGERYGLDILVYSGDDDSVCGLWGTQEWMNQLGLADVVTRWAPWKDAEGQPAGFVTQWANNVTLATVHGGGHEVPTYTPAVALQLFQWYLDRTWFDAGAFGTAEAQAKAEDMDGPAAVSAAMDADAV